jgi:hypothetical protein
MNKAVVIAFLLAVGTFTDFALTDVLADNPGGKTYAVDAFTVTSFRFFFDKYVFKSDGNFISYRGGLGNWTYGDYVVVSIWSSQFTDGVTNVTLGGLLVGPTLYGIGRNDDGDCFLINGSEELVTTTVSPTE